MAAESWVYTDKLWYLMFFVRGWSSTFQTSQEETATLLDNLSLWWESSSLSNPFSMYHVSSLSIYFCLQFLPYFMPEYIFVLSYELWTSDETWLPIMLNDLTPQHYILKLKFIMPGNLTFWVACPNSNNMSVILGN